MKILIIDTSKSSEVVVSLQVDSEVYQEKVENAPHSAQQVLPLIEKLLKDRKIAKEELTEIQVNCGPGSFTGLRVGVSIANMLGTLLQIPINNNKPGEPVEPFYE